MIMCNLFDVVVKVNNNENPVVVFAIKTDLPVGTQIIYSTDRLYKDAQGEDSLWVGQGERLTVIEGGECKGSIDINSSDRLAFEYYRQINLGSSPTGMSNELSDTVIITFTVGGRQKLREFGRNNINLFGSLVKDCAGVKIVESIHKCVIPINSNLRFLLA
jgi:hypothetical protein